MESGPTTYFATGRENTARQLARAENGILVGERNAVMLPGFDFGNSPTEVEQVNFSGKTVVHTTSAGTCGLLACANADEIITGAFVNAGAVAEYIRSSGHEEVSLVALGTAGVERSLEDTMCAMFIKNEVEEYPNSFATLKKFLATIPSAAKFFDPAADYAPERDFELCMELDRFSYVLKADPVDEDTVRLVRIDVQDVRSEYGTPHESADRR